MLIAIFRIKSCFYAPPFQFSMGGSGGGEVGRGGI